MKTWFHYSGTNKESEEVSGSVEADHVRQADELIRAKDVQPARLVEIDRTRVIELSLECYQNGWLSLLPLVGVFPGILSIRCFQRARMECGLEWNPAGRHLAMGAVMAWFGCFFSLAAAGLVFFAVIKGMGGD